MYAKKVYGVTDIIKYFELFLKDLITNKMNEKIFEAISIFFKSIF